MEYNFRKARQGEEKTVYEMIANRVRWMDSNEIHQWNDTDYLEIYPLNYYRENIDRLYVLTHEKTERILCAAMLFDDDERWISKEPSIYIHNFVSSLDCKGAGKIFIQMLEKLAKNANVSYLRLDSDNNNGELSSYYGKLGFEACGICHDGKYHGILRQKKI